MRKRELGQAFILVLILLAIGAALLVPALRLTSTSLKSSQIVPRQMRELYAADAAQEYILWKLKQPDFANSFEADEPQTFQFDACGVLVTCTVIMRAVESAGGMTLATEHVIKPTKTVEHQYLPDPVPDKGLENYTYTIELEQLSDNTTQGLDAIYDFPPSGISGYIGGSSELSLDGGVTWQDIPDPDTSQLVAKGYLKWPADYDWETGDGAFSSDNGSANYFYGIRDFTVRQVKKLRFQVLGRLDNDKVHCNWVVLKPWNTLSGPQAPITVGYPDNPGVCTGDQVLEVNKASDPGVIPPGVKTDIEYTISIKNVYTQTRSIREITDYLPPGFYYTANSTSNLTALNPIGDDEFPDGGVMENINGIDRQRLQWTPTQFPGGNDVSIASEETLTLTFWAQTTKDVSGLYYNEVIVLLKETGLPPGFGDIGVLASDYGSNYSWNTGAVMVPAYDSETESGNTTIYANISFVVEGIAITSWQVE